MGCKCRTMCQNKHILWLLVGMGFAANILYFNQPQLARFVEGNDMVCLTEGRVTACNHSHSTANGLQISEKTPPSLNIHSVHSINEPSIVRITDEDASFNLTEWREIRKVLLNSGGSQKLFLFSYMRGGSSIAGELFNCDPDATMWYEPGDAFFASYHGICHENLPQNDLYFKNRTRRQLDDAELGSMTNFYSDKFTCNYEGLPPQAMGHYFLGESTAMDGFMGCMKGKRKSGISINGCSGHISSICSKKMVETSLGAKCHLAIAQMRKVIRDFPHVDTSSRLVQLVQQLITEGSLDRVSNSSVRLLSFAKHGLCNEQLRHDNSKCLNKAIAKCTSDKVRVVQVNRMKMEDLESLIQRHPDINVVHYTRDPRGIALSRVSAGAVHVFDKTNVSAVREAEFICPRMREDIRQRRILEQKYPAVFTHITYESLTKDPLGIARKFYSLLQKSPPKGWDKFVEKNMYAKGASTGAGFGITVKNATETAMKWKKLLAKDQLVSIGRLCKDVIQDLGYPL